MNRIKDDIVLKSIIAIKIILSLFISYEIIFKGDAGTLVHKIGSFIVNGNYYYGLVTLISIMTVGIILINIALEKYNYVHKLKNRLFTFDVILTIVTYFSGALYLYNMGVPTVDLIFKISMLICGAAPLFILMSMIPIFFVRYTSPNKADISEDEIPRINNNPFTYKGRMTKLPYFITKSILVLMFVINIYLSQNIFVENMTIWNVVIFYVTAVCLLLYLLLSFFAAIKRLRDMKWKKYSILIWLLPYIGIVVGIPMFFVKSKYTMEEKQEQ